MKDLTGYGRTFDVTSQREGNIERIQWPAICSGQANAARIKQ
jgi:hypothetical protein